jgi:hypothetical protein
MRPEIALNKFLKLNETFNALLLPVAREERSDYAVTDQPCRFELCIDALQQRSKFSLGCPFRPRLNKRAAALGFAEVIGYELADKGRRLRCVPMGCCNLVPGKPDQTVTAFQRVIKERKFVLARERREPNSFASSTARGFLSTP